MSKELEALNDIRKVLEEAYKFPLNLTPQYKFIYEALKRNEPMKVIKDTVINGVCLDYNCPHCKERIDNDKYSKDQYYLIKHCISCGQKLKWSNEEEHY